MAIIELKNNTRWTWNKFTEAKKWK
jgi:hypothetical protein